MTTRFTPEEVVARYRRFNAQAIVGTAGVYADGGTWEPEPGQPGLHCALGIMLRGEPAPRYDRASAVKELYGIHYTSFYIGFDGDDDADEVEAKFQGIGFPFAREDFDLGQECRRAVTEANLWYGGSPHR